MSSFDVMPSIEQVCVCECRGEGFYRCVDLSFIGWRGAVVCSYCFFIRMIDLSSSLPDAGFFLDHLMRRVFLLFGRDFCSLLQFSILDDVRGLYDESFEIVTSTKGKLLVLKL